MRIFYLLVLSLLFSYLSWRVCCNYLNLTINTYCLDNFYTTLKSKRNQSSNLLQKLSYGLEVRHDKFFLILTNYSVEIMRSILGMLDD